jgi:Zn-dependent peptidase ImmA (M78 family)
VSEFRRGFKTEVNEIAREIRRELGLRDADRLDPWKLAAHLAIPVVPLSSLRAEAPRAARLFRTVERDTFSAVTVFAGTERMIVYNDSHSRGRQASDIAHELAHALLQHPAAPVFDAHGCRNWDAALEDEANWLAAALLISEEAALAIALNGTSTEAAAVHYGVSKQMLQFRLNVTGARLRVRRARGYHRR